MTDNSISSFKILGPIICIDTDSAAFCSTTIKIRDSESTIECCVNSYRLGGHSDVIILDELSDNDDTSNRLPLEVYNDVIPFTKEKKKRFSGKFKQIHDENAKMILKRNKRAKKHKKFNRQMRR